MQPRLPARHATMFSVKSGRTGPIFNVGCKVGVETEAGVSRSRPFLPKSETEAELTKISHFNADP